MGPFSDIFGVLFMLGGIALAAVWFFVPFAIFGTKSKLDDLIDELEKTNKELADIKAVLTRDTVTPASEAEDIPSIRATR